MPTFDLIDAKTWHCGQVIRILRREQKEAMAVIGVDSHYELRAAFDDSAYRRAWLIDGRLVGIGGVAGPMLSPFGMVWLALSNKATKYPLALVRLLRRELDHVMETKRTLLTTILVGDEASERFAVFMGFVPLGGPNYILGASSRFGRKEVARQMKEMGGEGYIRIMEYRGN
jgi:hypothetical protein